jgi:predicted secreted hydrolase
VSDVQAKQFYAFERFSREAQQLAGAELTPRFRVWLEDWALESLPQPSQHQTMKQTTFPLRVRANNGNVELSLTLDSIKPVVLQGTNGLSQKGTGVGNASYYYSLTRLLTQGTIRIGGEEFAVSGTSWIDREWSTSALDKGQVGWDWFALHLNDATAPAAAPAGTPTGQELMFYQLRKRDGSADSTSKGVLVRSDGSVRVLQVADISLSVETTWQHPVSQIRYPAAWRLQVPSEALDVRVTPHLADQELNVSVRYWEGAVKVVGKQGTKALAGNGYVELTGYGEQRGEQRAKPTP